MFCKVLDKLTVFSETCTRLDVDRTSYKGTIRDHISGIRVTLKEYFPGIESNRRRRFFRNPFAFESFDEIRSEFTS